MSIGLTDELIDLADSVAGFARRTAPTELTRGWFAELAKGTKSPYWDRLVAQELHRIHLPEAVGGAGGGLPELAVVAEQLGRALYPGPFLPTVISSAVVCASQTPVVTGLLKEFADGATGAFVSADGLSATKSSQGWRISGTSMPTIGVPGADIVVAHMPIVGAAEHLLVVIDPTHRGVSIETGENADLTRSAGRLHLRDYPAAAADVLADPRQPHIELIRNTLLAAEAAGVAQWCLDTTLAHIKQREQFGRPIGSFQAVQHKAALMLVHTELTRAAAWDAARAHDQPAEQQKLAAAQAAVTSLALARDVAVDAVLLLGGIGFTWEHDAHLYWRKAISLAAAGGATQRWATRLGELALTSARDYSFVDHTALPRLRTQIGETLDTAKRLVGTNTEDSRKRARVVLADAGLVAPHYPPPYGLGAGPEEQAVIAQEFARRGLPQPTTGIGEWVLPTLLLHGSPEQQRRFIAPTLRDDITWCQLFSEPGAGSDLAGLSTTARKTDGGWVINGQKVWTSDAHLADWGVCLARTDTSVPKHRGISYFLVNMASPGIEVRPLRQATGAAKFNEVFLTDVFVDDDCLVGQPGDGWKLAATTLSNERLSMGASFAHGSAHTLRAAIERGDIAADSAEALRVLGECTGREMALSALNLRGVLARMSGVEIGPASSVGKVYNAIAQRLGSTAILSLVGPMGCQTGSAPDYVIDHLGLPAVLTGGGTIEIQLNVIARRLLGLPGS